MPDFFEKYGGIETFPDFTKRITVLRELFEETNLLLASKNDVFTDKNPSLTSYIDDFNGNFI